MLYGEKRADVDKDDDEMSQVCVFWTEREKKKKKTKKVEPCFLGDESSRKKHDHDNTGYCTSNQQIQTPWQHQQNLVAVMQDKKSRVIQPEEENKKDREMKPNHR